VVLKIVSFSSEFFYNSYIAHWDDKNVQLSMVYIITMHVSVLKINLGVGSFCKFDLNRRTTVFLYSFLLKPYLRQQDYSSFCLVKLYCNSFELFSFSKFILFSKLFFILFETKDR